MKDSMTHRPGWLALLACHTLSLADQVNAGALEWIVLSPLAQDVVTGGLHTGDVRLLHCSNLARLGGPSNNQMSNVV